MRCTSAETSVFTFTELDHHDPLVVAEFLSSQNLIADSVSIIQRVLQESVLKAAFIGGSSFSAGFMGAGPEEWSVGLLSPEEMSVTIANTVMADHLQGQV
jgi:hypothetical protein